MRLLSRAGLARLVVLILLPACAPLHESPSMDARPARPLGTGPFFTLDTNEAKAHRVLAREQDQAVARCGVEHSCDQAHFTRALLALFENQQVAAKHFQQVLAVSPNGRLSALAQDWLQLLAEAPPAAMRDGQLGRTTQGLILELLHRDQMLQRAVTVREKKLEELSAQIEVLKQIDQEINEKSQRTRPRTKPGMVDSN